VTWLWILLTVLGLYWVGHGLLLVLWGLGELLRQLVFGTAPDLSEREDR
jgi:hypothetical protein